MGRTKKILGVVALSLVSQLAYAGEATVGEEATTPPAAGVQQTSEPPAEGSAPETPPPPVAREPEGPRVIWAEPGQAPEHSRPLAATTDMPRRLGFRLADVRWVVGLERASSFAGYSSTASDNERDVVTSGVEASIVGSSRQEAFSPLVLPRLALDRRWANGFSFGAVLSYAAHSAERSRDGNEATLPSTESALLGARIGWLRPLSRNVALWLRGGPTWARRASTWQSGDLSSVDQQWAISLEPQLVVMPLRHFGLSFGAAFDLGFGENKMTTSGGPYAGVTQTNTSLSTYGITAGLLALF